MDQFARNDGTKIYYVGGMAGEQIVLYKNTNLYCPKCGGNIVVESGEFSGVYIGRWFCGGCGKAGVTDKFPVESRKPEWSQLSKAKRRARRLAEAWAKSIRDGEVEG